MDELDARGYLFWAEMRCMVESGLVEIQSHAKTHTWYFSGPKIVDFHRPDGVDGYTAPMWLAWNRFPGEKYKSMHERMGTRIPYGEPVYRYGKSFAVRRYFEDPGLTGRLIAFVAENGGALDDAVRAMAEEARYLATTSLFDDPVRKNVFGEDPRDINRIGGGTPWTWHGAFIKHTSPGFFIALFDLFEGKPFSIWKYLCHTLEYVFRHQVMGTE